MQFNNMECLVRRTMNALRWWLSFKQIGVSIVKIPSPYVGQDDLHTVCEPVKGPHSQKEVGILQFNPRAFISLTLQCGLNVFIHIV